MPAKGYVDIIVDACKGCGLCVANCPTQCLDLKKEDTNSYGYHYSYMADEDKCIACMNCAVMCPDSVITVYKKTG